MSTETLSPIIEFSIGLAGFSAIVSVFLQRSTNLTDIDRVRVQTLLLLALTPAFIAFILTGTETIVQSSIVAARISSAILAALLSVFGVYLLKTRASLPKDQVALVSTSVFVFMLVMTVGNALIQTVSAVGYFGALAFTVVYFGLVAILIQGVLQFFRIIIARPNLD